MGYQPIVSKSLKKRRVLLIEPNYRNKYPPLGLMKLATYHRSRGDYVRFYKGDIRRLVVDLYADTLIKKFYEIDAGIDWRKHKKLIETFIQLGRKIAFEELLELSPVFSPSLSYWLKYYNKRYRTGRVAECARWDRICITTLFTFYFKKTIDTIQYCKKLVYDVNEIHLGGVMASVIPNEIEEETGITPHIGLLDKPGVLDANDTQNIDQLSPDYSILEEIDYNYPERDGYCGYTSRGCIRKCRFCAVPKLEPVFKEYLSISDQLKHTDDRFGARRNLLLLDNNVLASKRFPEIISEIQRSGFTVDAKFVSPNYLDIAVKNLRENYNRFAYRRQAHKLLFEFAAKLHGQARENFDKALQNYDISESYLPTTAQIIGIYSDIHEFYEKRRNKTPKARYVDFNQGVDARLINDKNMALLSSIPIRPLRIAFDSMKFAKAYEKAVRLAAKYKIRHLSNYLLYNFEDEPVELYQRMRLNVELSNELSLQIYSFPMRFSPITDENKLHHGRTFIGKHWNKKYIRAVQTVLNATKGKVGTKLDFFKAAFGRDEDEFFEILYMPEAYILHRHYCEEHGFTMAWRLLYRSLSESELNNVLPIIKLNDFSTIATNGLSERSLLFLEHYQVNCKDITTSVDRYKALIKQSYSSVTSAHICANEARS